MRTRIPLALSALVVIAVAITGCGAPTPTPTAIPTASGTPSSIESPLPRLPITCDELVSPPTVAEFAGEAVPLLGDGLDVNTWWDVAWRQSGSISCQWGTRDYPTLSVSVVPGGGRYFDAYLDSIYVSYYERYDAVGDRSVHSCAYGQCSFRIVVGDYVVDGYANRHDLMDELDLEPVMLPVLQELAGSVAAAIPAAGPAWSAPPDVLQGWGSGCGAGAPVAELAAIVGVPDLHTVSTDPGYLHQAVFDQVAPSWCTLESESATGAYVELVLIEGGGWTVDRWKAEPPVQWTGQRYEPIPTDGLGTAYLAVSKPFYTLLFVVDGSFVSFTSAASSRAEFLGWAPEVAELLSARGAGPAT